MIIDIIVLVVLLISALISFLRGFIREVLTILGVAGGAAAAWAWGPLLAPHVKDWLGVKEGAEAQRLMGVLPYPILGDILSYGAIFIAVVIVLSLFSHLVAESARKVGLGPVDRTLGVLFGLARGGLLLAILYLPVHIGVDDKTKETWQKDSRSVIYLDLAAAKLADLFPESTMKSVKETAEKAAEPGLREQLIQKGLLGGTPDAPAARNGAGGEGYGPQFREKMDQLFKGQDVAPQTPPSPSSPSPPPEAPHE